MSRKQVGAIDADLLAEVDKRAEWLGQTRRVFIERTLQKRLASADMKIDGEVHEAGEPVYVPRSVHRALANAAVRDSAQAKRDVRPIPKGGKS